MMVVPGLALRASPWAITWRAFSPWAERGCLSRSAWSGQVAVEFVRTVLAKRRGREIFNPAWSGGTLRLRQPRAGGGVRSEPAVRGGRGAPAAFPE